MIRFHTLGALQLSREDGTEIRSVLAQPKRVAVLTYLAAATPRGFHRRDVLLAMFWPELDDEHARGALNQSIYQLRLSLGSETIVSRGKEELGLNSDRIWCDAAAFEEAVMGDAAEYALELYRGEFMAGFHLSDTPEWERWLEGRRRELRDLAANAAWGLAEGAVAARPADAVRWGRRAVSLMPGDERYLRRFIELLDRSGDRAGAIRAYEEAAERFAREYGIDPSPETRQLIERIRTRAEPAPTADSSGSRVDAGRAASSGPRTDADARVMTTATPATKHRRTAAVLAALALLALLTTAILQWQDESPAALDTAEGLRSGIRLAVLPLDDLGSDPEQSLFTEGLHEELISSLARIHDLRVIARTSVLQFRDSRPGAGEVAEALDVQAILEGSVRWSGDDLRVALQLVDAASNETLWVGDYDVELTDVLTVQRDIANKVARALEIQIRPPERLPEGAGTDDPEAYTAYLAGRYFLGRLDSTSSREARDRFTRALDRDPTFAAAWGGLSEAYNNLTSLAVLPASEAYPMAREAAETALELDPKLAEAHAALATVLDRYYWDTEAAGVHFRRALELDPSSARARRFHAAYLRNLGRFEEALAEVRTAQTLDPLFAFSRLEEGQILYMARRYDEAIATYEELLRIVPGTERAYVFIGLARAQQERFEEALDALQRMDPELQHPDALAIRGYVYGKMGRPEDALRMLTRLEGLAAEHDGATLFQAAAIRIGLGQHDAALDLLERAVEQPTWHLRLLKVEPVFDPLRSDSRFETLLRQVGLAG